MRIRGSFYMSKNAVGGADFGSHGTHHKHEVA